MKKKHGIGRLIATIVLFFALVVFALIVADVNIGFLDAYTYNFKLNILTLTNQMGIELPEKIENYLTNIEEIEDEEAILEDDESEAEPETETKKKPSKVSFDNDSLNDKKTKRVPIAIDNASALKYGVYQGNVICASSTGVVSYNTKGKVDWTIQLHISEPILDVGKKYFVVADRNGTTVSLFEGKKKVFDAESDGNIKKVSVSENGDVVVVCDKQYYKGGVIVINKNGDRVFSWDSGNDIILDADISSGSRRLAISLLDTDAQPTSKVLFFDISKSDSTAYAEFPNSILFDAKYNGETLNAYTDCEIYGVKQNGKLAWQAGLEGKKLIHTAYAQDGYKLLVVEENSISELMVLTDNGKEKSVIYPETVITQLDIASGLISYSSGRDLVLCNVKGKAKKNCTCTREIRKIHIINNSTVMVVYNSGIEFIRFL